LVADIEFLRALHRDFDVRARGLNTLDRVVLGEQTGCEQVEADNQDAGTRPSKQSHDESLPSLELNSGAREPTIGNRPQLCSRTQREFGVSDWRRATSTPPLAVLSKREPQWAGRLRKNRGQTAHFARPFSENQRLTLRNGCQTPVFPQPASLEGPSNTGVEDAAFE